MAARLVVLGLFVAGCQCWHLPAVNQGRRAQFYTQQSDGSYQYGFDTAEGLYQSQQADPANEVQGQFGADGGSVRYTSGVGGFVVTELKKADKPTTYVSRGPVRYATAEELATHPEQVDDTAEVKAAKASFKAAYDAAAAAAEAAPDVNIITGAVPVVVETAAYSAPAVAPVAIKYAGPSAPLDASGRVEDTAEVKAAKASWKAAYDAAAAAAEAAPDTDIITGAAPIVAVKTYGAPVAAPVAIKYEGPVVTLDASGRVEDTAEVKAAKATFKATYDALAAAAEAAPDVNIITGAAPVVAVKTATYSAPAPQAAYIAPAIKYEGPVVTLDASGRVEDTAEVKAAKATFKATYDALAAAAEAAPDTDIITAPAAVPVAVSYSQTPAEIATSGAVDGSYQFSYTTADSSRYESADAANNVHGNFEFVAADDALRRRVDYKAGSDTGFVASGAHLPVAVQDTADVASAKASFRIAYDAAAAAAEAAPDTNIITGAAPVVAINTATYSAPAPVATYIAPAPAAIKYEGPVVTLDASGRVEDTAEVKAAKATFKATYDALAAAAEAAPDTDIITAPAAVPVAVSYSQAPAEIATSGAVDGSYQFSYTTADSSRYESADAANNVHGNFEFVAADDALRRRVDYKAGAETGFIASGAHLPVAVQDTADVASAKASFRIAYDAAAAAAEAAPNTDIITGAAPVVAINTATYSAPAPVATYIAPAPVAIKYEGPSAPLDASGRVEDTAEVKAAKAAFKAAYDAAAAAAAAAPDTNIITGGVPVVSVNTATYSAPAPQATYIAPAPAAIKYEGPSAPLDASGRVEDTAEVKAAKAAFKAAYDAAAAAAAAAPDTNIITASTTGGYSTVSVPVVKTTYSASHGNMRTITFDGITLMQVDGPAAKFGYSYE